MKGLTGAGENGHQLLVCVFGISGVGKTTMAREFVAHSPKWMHISASEILATGLHVPAESLRIVRKERILANQRVAINTIVKICQQHCDKGMLVDAHCVIDNDRELVPIPVSAIKPLRPALLIYVWGDPINVSERRNTASDRVRPIRTTEQLEHCQHLARTICDAYAEELDVPLRSVRSGDRAEFSSLLRALSGDNRVIQSPETKAAEPKN